MMKPLRPLSLAAALALSAGAGTAAAQTLIVRRVPVGSTVELVVNATQAGSAKPDTAGDVKIPIDLPAHTKKNEIDARVYVDTCDLIRRITVAERDFTALPPESGCTRQELTGVFVVRRVSSLLVNVGDPVATMLLRQGSVDLRPRGPRRLAPMGLVVFGGGSLVKYTDAVDFGCTNVPTCSGEDTGPGYTAGLEYWFSRYISAEASYFKPPDLSITGSGDLYRFTSSLEPHLITLAGKIGVPIGPVRLYGRAGFNYHRANSATTQHTDEITVTVGGFTTVTPAFDETVKAKTSGWGWLLGGGMEAWVRPSVAFYVEGGGAGVKGHSDTDETSTIDNRLTMFTAGLRVRIGGR
jgi:hypothetical protein